MRLITFILLVVLSQSIIHAAPGPIIGRLMNEPLSMLDYGLWRTELELKRYFISMKNIYIAARYDWKKDQIAIEVLLNEIPDTLRELEEKKQCESVIHSIKNYYGVEANKATLLGKSFIHNGFASTDISQDKLFKKLDNMTHLYVSIIRKTDRRFTGNTLDSSNLFTCESALIGSQIPSQ